MEGKKQNKTRKHRRAICTQKRMLEDNPEKRTQPISFFFLFNFFNLKQKKYYLFAWQMYKKKGRILELFREKYLKMSESEPTKYISPHTHTHNTDRVNETDWDVLLGPSLFFSDRHIPRGRTLDEAHCNIITHRSLIPWDDGFFEQQQSKVIHNFWVSLALWWPTCKRGRELYRYAESRLEEGEREKDFLSQFSSLAAAGANGCVEYRGSLCLGILLCANAI